eukprot:425990-Alexandrium_andersonii.AAC.1
MALTLRSQYCGAALPGPLDPSKSWLPSGVPSVASVQSCAGVCGGVWALPPVNCNRACCVASRCWCCERGPWGRRGARSERFLSLARPVRRRYGGQCCPGVCAGCG